MPDTRNDLSLEIGRELRALLAASRHLTAAQAAAFHTGLQPAAFPLATMLARHGASKAGRLAELLAMDKSAVSRLARSLCDLGLAEALPDALDGRVTRYALTDEGRAKLEAADQAKAAAFIGRFTGWSDAELAQFAALLHKFNGLAG